MLKSIALLIASLVSLASCAQFHPYQAAGSVIVRTQGYDSYATDRYKPAGPLAARIVGYSLLARQAYIRSVYDTGRPVEDHYQCEGVVSSSGGMPNCTPATVLTDEEREARLLKEWHYVAGCDYFYIDKDHQHRVDEHGKCPKLRGSSAEGLGVQLWIHEDGPVCKEAAIVFRGTVSGDVGDWESNLHWLRRELPGYDQYNQVHDYIINYLGLLDSAPCYREGKTEIVAIGHSLGGGLAQLAAYSDNRIRHVYAIDPSMVIGTDTVAPGRLRKNSQGLHTELIYEHGEILAYPRYLIRQFNPPTACNPRIVTERMKLLKGSPISQHSLTDFNAGLLAVSRGQKPESRPFILQDIPPCASS
ncbi:hypothetical protein ACMDCR_28190 [Labrys okinawensis]|uniref:hypothetical protein n=1 Tax=Labrys okinawensis TaxID=346911 RepID=UPI0039BC5C40